MTAIKVQHDGKDIEVQLPEGYISAAEVSAGYVPKDFMQEEIKRRLKGKTDPDSLLADEAFKTKALETWNVTPAKAAKQTGEDVEKLFKDWETKHLAPLKGRVDVAEARARKALERDRDFQILQAATEAGVKKQFLKGGPSQKPLIVKMFEDAVGFAEDHDGWYAKDGDGFAFSSKPNKDQPYRGVSELVSEWAKDPANTDWLDDVRQRGAAFQKAGQGSGPHTISREDARDMSKYVAAKEAAEKAGGRLEIEPPPSVISFAQQ